MGTTLFWRMPWEKVCINKLLVCEIGVWHLKGLARILHSIYSPNLICLFIQSKFASSSHMLIVQVCLFIQFRFASASCMLIFHICLFIQSKFASSLHMLIIQVCLSSSNLLQILVCWLFKSVCSSSPNLLFMHVDCSVSLFIQFQICFSFTNFDVFNSGMVNCIR